MLLQSKVKKSTWAYFTDPSKKHNDRLFYSRDGEDILIANANWVIIVPFAVLPADVAMRFPNSSKGRWDNGGHDASDITPDIKAIIPKNANTAELTRFSYKMGESCQEYKAAVLKDEYGLLIAINTDFIKHFNDLFDGLQFRTDNAYAAVQVCQDGQTVGVVMPLRADGLADDAASLVPTVVSDSKAVA